MLCYKGREELEARLRILTVVYWVLPGDLTALHHETLLMRSAVCLPLLQMVLLQHKQRHHLVRCTASCIMEMLAWILRERHGR